MKHKHKHTEEAKKKMSTTKLSKNASFINLCKQCGNELRATPQDRRLGRKQFCDNKCKGLFMSKHNRGENNPSYGKKAWNTGLLGYHSGDKHWNWKGGFRKNSNGYIEQYAPNHPAARHGGYVYQHRLVIEKSIGRFLRPEERIHHINKNKSDNRIENLKLFANDSEHLKYHAWLRKNNLTEG